MRLLTLICLPLCGGGKARPSPPSLCRCAAFTAGSEAVG